MSVIVSARWPDEDLKATVAMSPTPTNATVEVRRSPVPAGSQ